MVQIRSTTGIYVSVFLFVSACNCTDANMQCVGKTTACQPTCNDPTADQTCDLPPAYDTCVCKSGYILFNGHCIRQKDCGCVDRDGTPRQVSGDIISTIASPSPKRLLYHTFGVETRTYPDVAKTIRYASELDSEAHVQKQRGF